MATAPNAVEGRQAQVPGLVYPMLFDHQLVIREAKGTRSDGGTTISHVSVQIGNVRDVEGHERHMPHIAPAGEVKADGQVDVVEQLAEPLSRH